MQDDPLNQALTDMARKLMDTILDDPDVQSFLDQQTEAFLGRPFNREVDDEAWWACRKTMGNLLLLAAMKAA